MKPQRLRRNFVGTCFCVLAAWVTLLTVPAAADESQLLLKQDGVAKRYERLEELLLRMADVEAAENPERAALLRRAAKQSRDQFVLEKLRDASKSIENQKFQDAIDNQEAASEGLKSILTLLMSEDRSKRIRDEKERVAKLISDLKRIERSQRSTRARTENGADLDEVKGEQKDIAKRSEELKDQISEDNEFDQPEAESKDSESAESESAESDAAQSDAAQESDSKSGDASKSEENQESDSKPMGDSKDDPSKSDKPSDSDGKPSEEKPTDGKPSEAKPSEAKPSESKPSDSQPSDGKPSESSESKPSQSKPSPSQDGKPSESSGQPQQDSSEQDSAQQQPQTPQQQAEQELQEAIEKMEQAQKELDDAKRDQATERQREAEAQLRKAIDRLEKILRQLREEEMMRELARLEGRLKRMAAMQTKVYEDTVALSAVPQEQRNRQTDLKAGNLSFEEKKITMEADRAMLLLREEGSSVAFPEVVAQIRDDTDRVAQRLGESKIDVITQGIQQDILAALEEMILSLQQAQRDLEKQQQQNQQQPQQQQGGEQEQPLVDSIAELKLIRTMETRIKSTTQRYAQTLESGETSAQDLLPLLKSLSDRQQRLYQITRDLVMKRNQ
ncbi:hypothetical protein [Stieleria varia]|nr:hypothetical protein [Stieleria varia]